MVKMDPHKQEEHYARWKDQGKKIEGISRQNEALLKEYIEDMEVGRNVSPSSSKGGRGYARLNNLRSKMKTLTLLLEKEMNGIFLGKLSDEEIGIIDFFHAMRKGKFKDKRTGRPYRATGTYVKVFKAFWNWYIRFEKKGGMKAREEERRTKGKKGKKIKGRIIPDITTDLDGKDDKPKFHYFTIEDLKKLCDHAKYDYKVMMWFLFDSGIRAPSELMNIRYCDLKYDKNKGFYMLEIREETSKTFGRKIKLMLCSQMLKKYLEELKPKKEDYIFTKAPFKVNLYLNRLGNRVLGFGKAEKKVYPGRKSPSTLVREGLSMYDFRHSSACYWLPRYKSESALKYRFGWKKSDMIYYYSEFLGMKDTITEHDLIDSDEKASMQKELEQEKISRQILEERMGQMQETIASMQIQRDDIINELIKRNLVEKKKSA